MTMTAMGEYKSNDVDFFTAAANHPNFAYSRARAERNGGVHIYHRDPTSPTGVWVAAWLMDTTKAMEILDAAGRTSPLSPTEGLNKSGASAA